MVNEFAKKRWAVVGFDYDFAFELMGAIERVSKKQILRRKIKKLEGRNMEILNRRARYDYIIEDEYEGTVPWDSIKH